jgi:hypothetical protein
VRSIPMEEKSLRKEGQKPMRQEKPKYCHREYQ